MHESIGSFLYKPADLHRALLREMDQVSSVNHHVKQICTDLGFQIDVYVCEALRCFVFVNLAICNLLSFLSSFTPERRAANRMVGQTAHHNGLLMFLWAPV